MTIDNVHADDLASATAAWADQWYDGEAGLLWNPPGSFGGVIADQSVHLIPQSAWYAAGLMHRDGAGDRERAEQVIASIIATQYDRPGKVWHGTFARFAEWPEPPADAIEWDDYDPNWRQFVGTTWLLILRHFEDRLRTEIVEGIDRSLRLAVVGEPPERVAAWYTNIALMRAVLEVEAGHRLHEPEWVDRGHALGESLVQRRERQGAFDEFNSPTYYGIDFYGLALWRTCAASSRLRDWGASMETALWAETALLYHAGLGNLCGPYTRSYGMDLHRYVAALALWLWPVVGREATPLPELDAPSIDHGHDLCLGPMIALLGSAIPDHITPWFAAFPGPSQVERLVSERPRRVVTASLDADLMLGAEENDQGWPAWHQYYPATIHWRASEVEVGTVRFVHNGATSARAEAGELTIEADPARDERSNPTFLVDVAGFEASSITSGQWDLPGLRVEIETDAQLAEVLGFGNAQLIVYRPAAGAGGARFRLRAKTAHIP